MPLPPILKVDMDGSSVDHTLFFGGGFLIRDSNGFVLHAISQFYGGGIGFQAKVTALLNMLLFFVERSYFAVYFECDSKILVDMVRIPWPSHQRHKLSQIQDLLISLHIMLDHIYCETNLAVNWLANQATFTMQTTTYNVWNLPVALRGIITLDVHGFSNFRVRYKTWVYVSIFS